MRDSRGRFVKRKTKRNPAKKRKRTHHASASAPRRRRRRVHAAPRVNPPRRRHRRRRHHARRNPGPVRANPRRRRRRGYRRNPSPVVSWLLAGTTAVMSTIGLSVLLPNIVPASLQARPILYPVLLCGLGVGAGVGLQKAGLPTLAVGIGLPILTLGGLLLYVGAMSSAAAAPRANPRFRDVHRSRQIPGPGMGSLAAFTPAGMGAVYPNYGSMGAVYPSRSGYAYGAMGAVESMVGVREARPVYYSRAGAEMGAT